MRVNHQTNEVHITPTNIHGHTYKSISISFAEDICLMATNSNSKMIWEQPMTLCECKVCSTTPHFFLPFCFQNCKANFGCDRLLPTLAQLTSISQTMHTIWIVCNTPFFMTYNIIVGQHNISIQWSDHTSHKSTCSMLIAVLVLECTHTKKPFWHYFTNLLRYELYILFILKMT